MDLPQALPLSRAAWAFHGRKAVRRQDMLNGGPAIAWCRP